MCVCVHILYVCKCAYAFTGESIRAESKYMCLIERTDDTAPANLEMSHDKFDEWIWPIVFDFISGI